MVGGTDVSGKAGGWPVFGEATRGNVGRHRGDGGLRATRSGKVGSVGVASQTVAGAADLLCRFESPLWMPLLNT